MRALFVVDGGVEDPASRARVHQLLPALATLGVEARVLGPGRRRKWKLLPAAREADVVVLQRVLPPRPLLAALARANGALVFDFDDALYTLRPLRRRLDAMLATATEVVAGSVELARAVEAKARAVSVVPTVVDPAAYEPVSPRPASRAVRLGWLGSAGGLPFLDVVRPALAALRERGRDFELRVISSTAPAWPELPVVHVPWSLRSAAAALHELDVGIAPLPDTAWTRGKCGLKALEYMACGLPVVASPVGALATIVVPEQTGLLAAPDGWTAPLERLLDDPDLRGRLGTAGRRRVEEHYSVEVAAPALAAALDRAVASRRKSAA